jgi:hypothetical protein
MKKAILVLVLVFVAATLYAGDGKSCDTAKATKSVELTGTVVLDGDKAIFRVSDSTDQYDICHKSKASLKKLSAAGKAVRVSGKLVSCSEGEGTELMIESAKSI